MTAPAVPAIPARPGPWMRYRARYATLPPAVQMIGLQLWLPLLFVIAFCLCYINAFHQPAPKGVKVTVIGSEQQVGTLARGLQTSGNGALSVSVAPSVQQVSHDIRTGDLGAAFTPGSPGVPAHLTISSATQFQIAQMTRQTFGAAAAAESAPLTVDDLAPLPKQDSYGTAGFYLALVWTISGYMVAMFVGLMGAPLRHRVRLGIIAGSGLVLSLLATVLAGPVVGAVHGHFLQMWMLGWATSFAVGVVVNGLSYFLGRFVTGAALVLFVFLNIPASGGAFPRTFVPEPFRSLHEVVVGSGVLDVLRSVLYHAGPGVGRGALVLGSYAVVGLILSVVGKLFAARRARRRTERGAPIPMMLAAQAAAMAAARGPQAAAEGAGPGQPAGQPESAGAPVAASNGARPAVNGTSPQHSNGHQQRDRFAEEQADGDVAGSISGAEVHN